MRLALFFGPALLAATFFLPPPGDMSREAWVAAGLALLMALWWVVGVLPLAATALLPLVLAPVLGLASIDEVAPSYANPLIMLFLGGFLVARAIERVGLHARIAHSLLARAGTSPPRVLAALMVATGFLSLWISNTASTMVVAPIAAAVAAPANPRLAATLMLGVAYAATIGGMGSLIGTPPNAIFAAYVADTQGLTIGFAEWAMVGMPVSLVLMFAAWVVLAYLTPGLGGATHLPLPPYNPHPLRDAEARVAIVAGLTALGWITRPWLAPLLPGLPISDAGIALTGALALFLLPDGKGQGGRLLDWDEAARIRWDVLILFGGGLALARLIDTSGLAAQIGQASAGLAGLPLPILLLTFAALIVYLGELASNTATAALFMPIAGAAAVTLGIDPVVFMLPVALAASIGFMLPVATPPNAIVFSHPEVTRARMLRAGAVLNLLGLLVAVGIAATLGPILL
ncbi:SLC13 family permease [Sinisalibacter lacisalsi]|uniref:Di- and tricarboxylate transporter n=1 Tax=Sinisalibacter lacisalsi TaxID=1526570 RepID=A0ABQ1QHS4_9RHOB|nr:DASS family sodium-coupled anion symporter [Sinisalibacter lacisalsi]GGD26675.1 di- and tricarboxylate transporter [Sinisalibacter lacisalsi]